MKHSNLYLVGPMGAGKTAVGRQLARELRLKFFDSDAEIEKRTGVDIPFIFEKEGEARFREREADVLAELTTLDRVVVATGGGAVLDAANRARLAATGTVIYLKAGVEQQLKRTQQARNRPLLLTEDARTVLERLAKARGPLYEEIADLAVDTNGQRVKAVAAEVRRELERLGRLPGAPRT